MFKKSKSMLIITIPIIVFELIVCPLSVSAQSVSIDDYLLNAGFPQPLIDEMSEPQKEYIYEHSNGESITFCGYEEKDFIVNDNGKLVETPDRTISIYSGSLTSSDMTLSVVGTKSYRSGIFTYSVYPCFKWHTSKSVKNDSFAMSMYPGWEAIPGERNLRLHLMNSQGKSAQYVDLSPSASCSTGYSYKIPSNTGILQALYEGYAYYQLDKTSSSASPRISLCYTHDASPLMNVSYNLNLGVGSISLSGNSSWLYTMSDNFTVSGLD